MRGWTIGLWLGLVLVSAGADATRACTSCTPWSYCQQSRMGALLCLGNGYGCTQGGKCNGPGMVEDSAIIGLTLLDDAPVESGPLSRVAQQAGPAVVGRAAARIAGQVLGAGVSETGVLYAGVGFFDEGTAAFRSAQGDGFTLQREHDGRGAHLTVRALAGGQPGRVLASERLGEDDALVVRVPFEGRRRVLVVTAALVSAAEAESRQAAAQRELAASAASGKLPQKPPFELELLEH